MAKQISDTKPRSRASNHIKKLSIPLDATIFFSIITKLENTVQHKILMNTDSSNI